MDLTTETVPGDGCGTLQVSPSSAARRVIEVTGLDKVFTIASDESGAAV